MDIESKVLKIIKRIKNDETLYIDASLTLTKPPINFTAVDFVYLYLLIYETFEIKLDQNLLLNNTLSTVNEITNIINKVRESHN